MAFKKGKTGNPRGRPKNVNGIDLKKLCRQHTIEAVQALVRGLHGLNAIQAATKLLEWGHGKPTQEVELSGKDGAPLIIKFELDK